MRGQYLVAVGITTYNSNLVYLSETIDSAIMQTYRNIEIIICDDGSANIDEIESLIKNKNDERIVLLKNDKNTGVSNSLNNIINFSKGAYFTWCPDDDWMHPSKVELQIKSLESKPKSISISNHMQVLEVFKINREINHNLYLKFMDAFLYLTIFDRINGGSLMIPTKILKKRKFNLSMRHVQDYDMWLYLFSSSTFVFVNKVLLFSRNHLSQTSKKNNAISKKEINKFYLDFIKKNIYNLIYYYGKKLYLLIIIFYTARNITVVADYLIQKDNFKKHIVTFSKSSKFFLILMYLSKIAGLMLFIYKTIKNFISYKILFKFANFDYLKYFQK